VASDIGGAFSVASCGVVSGVVSGGVSGGVITLSSCEVSLLSISDSSSDIEAGVTGSMPASLKTLSTAATGTWRFLAMSYDARP